MDNTGKKAKQSTIGYREMLPCGCYLAIEGKNAYVAYDFLSVYHKREMEYRVPLDKIHKHLEYLKENLKVYDETKDQIPKIVMSATGKGGMRIWYNNEYPGVCIEGDYFAVETWEEYEVYEKSFLRAEEIAKKYLAKHEGEKVDSQE